ALLLGAGALLLRDAAVERWNWQPARWTVEPWRLVTAAWLHLSQYHLAANLAGTLLVALLGQVARLPPRAALAWLLAWPCTQALLLLRPALQHYAGLSGVLH